MKNYRFGKFRFGDYLMSWVSIVLLLFFSVASIIFELSPLFIFFPAIFAGIWFLIILLPQFEKFVIDDNSIVIERFRKKETIILPYNVILIVSYADICPPLAIRTVGGNETHILKNKIAISILYDMPIDDVLVNLHKNFLSKYTSSTIQMVFNNNQFIYSFVYDQFMFNKLITNRNCKLIIPESLLHKFDIDLCKNFYVDVGY